VLVKHRLNGPDFSEDFLGRDDHGAGTASPSLNDCPRRNPLCAGLLDLKTETKGRFWWERLIKGSQVEQGNR